jgi:hypothetical protein
MFNKTPFLQEKSFEKDWKKLRNSEKSTFFHCFLLFYRFLLSVFDQSEATQRFPDKYSNFFGAN